MKLFVAAQVTDDLVTHHDQARVGQESRLILVGGLPGSGKTHLIKQLVAAGWKEFDDFQANAIDNQADFSMSGRYRELISDLKVGRRCVVADIRVVTAEYRASAERALRGDVPDVVIELFLYANDPKRCEANVLRDSRDPAARLEKIREYTRRYSVPIGITPIPVGG